MPKRRFILISRYLEYRNVQKPAFVDNFWLICQMFKQWNDQMAGIFLCAWVICLDKLMLIWHNKWTCPSWVFCPQKPHSFGNEYHTACCALSKIMFMIEWSRGVMHLPRLQYGKTVGLLLRMLQSYFHTARYIILDSGFCVLKGIIELCKNGLFGCALIKNGGPGLPTSRGTQCNNSFMRMG